MANTEQPRRRRHFFTLSSWPTIYDPRLHTGAGFYDSRGNIASPEVLAAFVAARITVEAAGVPTPKTGPIPPLSAMVSGAGFGSVALVAAAC